MDGDFVRVSRLPELGFNECWKGGPHSHRCVRSALIAWGDLLELQGPGEEGVGKK